MTSDCRSNYLGNNVRIEDNFRIVPRTNNINGYDENLCLSCTNGYQTMERRGLRFTQGDRCDGSMFVQTNTKLSYEFLYSRFDYQNVGNSWNTFFRVDNGCPSINKCAILERGCNKPYTGTNLRLTNGETQIQA